MEEKYCNRKIKKNLLLMNIHIFYVLERKTSNKNFSLSVCTYVRMWVPSVGTITVEGVSGSN